MHRLDREEHGQQPGRRDDLDRDRRGRGRLAQAAGQRLRRGAEAVVGALVEHPQRGQPGRDGERVPAQRARLVDVAGRRDVLHELDGAPVGGGGQPATDDLAEHGQVGQDAGQLLRAALGQPEAGDDLVEDEQRARRRGALAQQVQEAGGRRDEAHVRRVGLAQERGQLVALGGLAQGRGVVPGDDHGVRRGRLGHAGAGRDRLGGQAAARLGKQAVDVAVVGARELEDLLAAGRGAGEADRAHRGLGARRGHAHHRHAGHAAGDLVGEVDLGGGRRPEARAALGGGGHGGDDLRMRVTVDQRAPRADPVDVAVAVDVDHLGARRTLDEDRVAPDRAHRPHRRVDAAGQPLDGARVQLRRARVAQRGGRRAHYAPACVRSHSRKASVK